MSTNKTAEEKASPRRFRAFAAMCSRVYVNTLTVILRPLLDVGEPFVDGIERILTTDDGRPVSTYADVLSVITRPFINVGEPIVDGIEGLLTRRHGQPVAVNPNAIADTMLPWDTILAATMLVSR